MTKATEGRTRGKTVDIRRVETATDQEAIHSFATDLLRRAKAGELKQVAITAQDNRANTLRYRMAS